MFSLRNKKIIFELSSLPPLIWSSASLFTNVLFVRFLNTLSGTLSFAAHLPVSQLLKEKPGRVAQWVGHLTRNILSFLFPLFQEGQLSVTGESMCTKYWLTA